MGGPEGIKPLTGAALMLYSVNTIRSGYQIIIIVAHRSSNVRCAL